jgi:tRNA pseudouridine55 synthase
VSVSPDGVLVVDKPRGPTSHDIVAMVRRALSTRAVGHAGTLDPMATGVLVVAVGEATKLVRWLTADDKRYLARVSLEGETDTLDAEGRITERAAPEQPITLERARAAAERFVGTIRQRPPAFSAIKVDGQRLHERARRGEDVEAPERDVVVHALDVLSADGAAVELDVRASKGFYVRSLGRDLARALGARGHLTSLRRVASGAFTLEGALDGEVLARAARGDDEARARVRAALLSLPGACGGMPSVRLDARGAEDARHGRALRTFPPELGEGASPIALFDEHGQLVAIGARDGDRIKIVRGMRPAGG